MRLDPRTKLLILAVTSVSVFVNKSIAVECVLAGIPLVLLSVSGNLKRMLKFVYRQGRQETRAPPSGSPGWPGHCRFGICAGHGRSQGVWAGGAHRKSS